MSVNEYAFKFTELSRYAPTTIVDPRSRMNKFIFGVSKMVVKECRTSMLINDMEISHLMVHDQQIKEDKLMERYKEAKRAKTSNGSSNAPPKFNKDRVSNPKPEGVNDSVSLFPTYAKCGRKHEGKCLADTDGCCGFGKSGHKIRDCPMLMAKWREKVSKIYLLVWVQVLQCKTNYMHL
ncbi:hypothetical protein MTR67_012042 [Solanum verrucosum]|uniref:Gag-pol polyprotein n=1 Tax=Solanum verrucosum TaxID=315347 RepID=A0AAF0Q7Y9_SOLVR|nr:hypothetical protein MTR67_012042 [Solanum verrucosum]